MITCIKCGGFISHDSSNIPSIHPECAGELVDKLSTEELLAMAKVGIDAVIDEVTGYQVVRPKDELSKRHKRYREKKK